MVTTNINKKQVTYCHASNSPACITSIISGLTNIKYARFVMLCSISFTLGYYNIQSYWKPYMAQFMNLKTKTKIWTAVPWNEKPVCYPWAILMSFLCFTLFRSPDLPKSGGPRFGRSNLDPASLVEVMRLKRCFWEIGKLPHVSCTCIPENEKKNLKMFVKFKET